MTFTLFTPIEKPEPSRFVNVHRHYEQPGSGYENNQQQKRNNKDNNAQQSPIKSVKQDNKTGELIIKYQNGVVKKYTNDNPNYNTVKENLRYQNYSTNFDFKA